jgi:hypothetical protein
VIGVRASVGPVTQLRTATWAEIEALRDQITSAPAPTLEVAARRFTSAFADTFPSVVLARVFLVVPFGALPASERAIVAHDPRRTDRTPVLTLLATRGREPAWNDRTRSVGHRAIPLLDAETVQGAPMIARLLAELEVDVGRLWVEGPIATRVMAGGQNALFYVADAQTARDSLGRPIIQPAFAKSERVASVFGMGGAYLDDTLVIAIVFTTEPMTRQHADRFASFISSFKIATMAVQESGTIWAS